MTDEQLEMYRGEHVVSEEDIIWSAMLGEAQFNHNEGNEVRESIRREFWNPTAVDFTKFDEEMEALEREHLKLQAINQASRVKLARLSGQSGFEAKIC